MRMLRAVVLAARLDFTLDPPVEAAIATQRHRLAHGLAGAADRGVLQGAALGRRRAHVPGAGPLSACSSRSRRNCRTRADDEGFLDALDALDTLSPALRRGAADADQPDPARHAGGAARPDADARAPDADDADRRRRRGRRDDRRPPPPAGRRRRRSGPPEPLFKIGLLPIARRDIDRLRQLLAVQRRLQDMEASPRAKRALLHRGPFEDALTWLEVHGRAPEIVEHWRGFIEASSLPATARRARGRRPHAPATGDRRRGGRRSAPPATRPARLRLGGDCPRRAAGDRASRTRLERLSGLSRRSP